MKISTALAAASSLLIIGADAFNNPVIPDGDNPDPGAILYNGQYYIVTTGGDSSGNKFPIHVSQDLQNWQSQGFAIPVGNISPWIGTPFTDFWAPEIHVVNGTFHLYYTARDNTGILCIAVATSDNILGPYLDSGAPLIRQTTVGSIDATFMQVGADNYLIWKDDGNGKNPQEPTQIWAAQLNNRGTQVVGQWVPLIKNDLPWEGALVEAPWILQHGSYYYLFYSGNGYCGDRYAVGVARSKNPLGPYEKRAQPIRVSDQKFIGPGHCSVLKTPSNQFVMLYHSWIQGEVCSPEGRKVMVDYIKFNIYDWPILSTANEFESFLQY